VPVPGAPYEPVPYYTSVDRPPGPRNQLLEPLSALTQAFLAVHRPWVQVVAGSNPAGPTNLTVARP